MLIKTTLKAVFVLLTLGGGCAVMAQMSTPGSFRVSETGAAVYEIPIKVPPGIAGMEPKLSLIYNSQSGNGLLGVGWSLQGLSAITRCPRTMAQDGVRGGVNYDANDRFCLDGQRLIAISGPYGADGTQYRTERDSFARIYSYGTAGNGPSWFKVQTKSGQTIEYGNTEGSRIEAQGKTSVRIWAVNKIQDAKGNFLKVSYWEGESNGDYHPTQIDYTGNTGASLEPAQSVRFTVESRTDVAPAYVGGSVLKTLNRLSNVKTYIGASLVKGYQLTYDNNGAVGRTRLSSLQECDASNACLPATTFQVQAGGIGLLSPAYSTPALPATIGGFASNHSQHQYMLTGDFNGDGKTDYMYIPNGSDGRWLIAYGTRDGFTTPSYASPAIPATLSSGHISYHSSPQYNRTGDFNGDGKTDYMWVPQNSDGRWLVAYSTGTGFTLPTYSSPALPATVSGGYTTGHSQSQYMRNGDFNGDGKTDYMWIPQNSDGRWLIAYANSTGTGFTEPSYSNPALPYLIDGYQSYHQEGHYMHNGDFNGDGKTDYMWIPSASDGRVLIAYATETGFVAPSYSTPALPGSISGYYSYHSQPQYMFTGDFNGDGKTDYMWMPNNSDGRWLIAYGTGAGLTIPDYANPALPARLPSNNIYTYHTGIQYNRVGDFNGDGKTDYMWIPYNSDGRWLIAYSNGNGFVLPDYASPALPASVSGGYTANHSSWQYNITGDFNGDGKADFMWIPQNSDGRWLIAHSTAPMADLLTSIQSESAPTMAFSYEPLTNIQVSPQPDVYEKSTDASGDQVDLQFPLYVVYSATIADGLVGNRATTYFYKGLKAERGTGRGLLGFKTVQATDVSTSVKTLTEFRQDWPYVGLPVQSKRIAPDGTTILSQTDYTYSCLNPATGGACTLTAGNRYFPYASQVDETSRELNNSFMTKVRTQSTYDSLGNATQIVVNHLDSAGTATGYSKTTTNTFTNNTTDWILGRLIRSEVQSTIP